MTPFIFLRPNKAPGATLVVFLQACSVDNSFFALLFPAIVWRRIIALTA